MAQRISDGEFARQFTPPPTPIRALDQARAARRREQAMGSFGRMPGPPTNPWYGQRVKLVNDHGFSIRTRAGDATYATLPAGAKGTVWCCYTWEAIPMVRVLMDAYLHGYDYPVEMRQHNFVQVEGEAPRPDLLEAVGHGPDRPLPMIPLC